MNTLGVLRFVLVGKRAHFRRYYTNSSALSYPVPPPASLLGLMGAALGLGPEYGQALEGIFLAVRPLGRHRALMQTMSHLFLKRGGLEELRGLHPDGRTQIPIQMLVAEGGGSIRYEVWVASQDKDLLRRLRVALEDPNYPLSLGPAFALAWVEELEEKEGLLKKTWKGKGIGWWRVGCLVNWSRTSETKLYRDRFPVLLSADRTPLCFEELVLELEGKPIEVDYRDWVLVLGENEGIGGLFITSKQDGTCM